MSRPFRFGVVAGYAPSRAAWIGLARRAEELGYAVLLTPDRTSGGTPSPVPALAVAASATTTLRVGTYVFANGYRHPVTLAREVATLDVLTDGRFELGLGTGVSAEEYQQMGLPFPSTGKRVDQLEETVTLLKKLLTQETVDFSGTYYKIDGLHGAIKTVQQPHIPFLIAASGERTLKLAGREADIVAVGSKIGSRAPDFDDDSLQQKIAWIKEGAGERFSELELSQTVFDIEVTDSNAPLPPQSGHWSVPRHPLSTEQAVERLLQQRERYGFSYLHVSMQQIENFAPVLARLANK
jgi:probable F420-dependent oxidoreductase